MRAAASSRSASGLIALLILVPYRALIVVHAAAAAAAGAAVILVIRGQPEIARGDGDRGCRARARSSCVVAARACAPRSRSRRRRWTPDRRLRLPSRPARAARDRHRRRRAARSAVAIGPGLVDRGLDELRGPPPADRVGRSGRSAQHASAARGTACGRRRSTSMRAEPLARDGPGHVRVRVEPQPALLRSSSATRTPSTSRAWPRRAGSGLAAGLLFLGGLAAGRRHGSASARGAIRSTPATSARCWRRSSSISPTRATTGCGS